MRTRNHRLFPFAIVLLLSMATVVHGYHRLHEDGGPGSSSLSMRHAVLKGFATRDHLLTALTDHPFPGQHGQKERRHGKSLLSEAIAADPSPVVQPDFTYCQRVYSRYLPGGCSQERTGNFSLRGPPSRA